MGALTSNRKRGGDYLTVNYKYSSLYSPEIDTHISKKPKLSTSVHQNPNHPISSTSSASRIYRYPEPLNRLQREVHAPIKPRKFGFSKLSSGGVVPREREGSLGVWNVLAYPYERAKTAALSSFRYFKKDKEVIDIDLEAEKNEVLEDSSIEEVEIVEDGREGRSVDSDQGSRERNGVVENLVELDGNGKVAERNFQPSTSSMVSDLTNANLKTLDSLSLSRDSDDLGVPLHKILYGSAEKRNDKLSKLRFQIDLIEKWRATWQLFRPAKKQEEDVVREPFVPLTKQEEVEVSRAFSSSDRREVLVMHENSNIEITGEVLQCLRPGAWLNDEVINVYLELLKERAKREPQKFLKCHFFNTFFYGKLIGGKNDYDFKSVRRWTTQRKLGYSLFECDKIFVPIHQEVHWCLAVINKKDEKFQYLDSLRGADKQVMKVLARYFVDEVKDKNGKDIDVSSWKQEYVVDLPEQENGYDCGMFMIKYADFYSRDVGLCFNQEHMPYFRLRTAKEILRLKAE